MSNQSLEELVKKWSLGDKSVFNAMHPELGKIVEVSLKIRRVRSSRDDYEDIRQECWIEVMKNLVRWDPTRGSIKNFLIACCSNRILKLIYRKQKYEKSEHWHCGAVSYAYDISQDANIRNWRDLDNQQFGDITEKFTSQLQSPELDLEFDPRLRGFRVDYITRRIFLAIFFEVFETEKKKIFAELLEITRLSKRKLAFLIDYAAVTIRLHLMLRST